jgi:hypothetical protein
LVSHATTIQPSFQKLNLLIKKPNLLQKLNDPLDQPGSFSAALSDRKRSYTKTFVVRACSLFYLQGSLQHE